VRDDTPKSLVRLLAGLIDYAGLFPPAGLSMPDAVARYARYRQGAHDWALGRFIVPAARLEEFARALEAVEMPAPVDPWRLSILADWPLPPAFAQVASFTAAVPIARVESVECKVACADDLEALAAAARGFETFAEMALAPLPVDLLIRAAALGCAAKIRTGGTDPRAFPRSDAVAAFLSACVSRGIPFKATAGLHHPVRSPRPVTYEPGAPCATMHGFLNVFLGTALLQAGVAGQSVMEALLEETDASAFVFEDDRAGWRGHWVTTAGIAAARQLARSFGSCSFEEPIEDLTTLALLAPASTTAT